MPERVGGSQIGGRDREDRRIRKPIALGRTGEAGRRSRRLRRGPYPIQFGVVQMGSSPRGADLRPVESGGASAVATMTASTGVLRHSRSDGVLVVFVLSARGLLMVFPSSPLIALGLWWNANTISHNFVHLPFFRSPVLNRLYSIYLTLLLGIPHSIWRERHLRHHSEHERRPNSMDVDGPGGKCEIGMIAVLWIGAGGDRSEVFCRGLSAGYLVGLGLCHMQGYFEHARGTTSHYGQLYNLIFFNDGYHVEHHRRPSEHWTRLPQRSQRTRCRAAGRRFFDGWIRSISNRSSTSYCARSCCSTMLSERTSARFEGFSSSCPRFGASPSSAAACSREPPSSAEGPAGGVVDDCRRQCKEPRDRKQVPRRCD